MYRLPSAPSLRPDCAEYVIYRDGLPACSNARKHSAAFGIGSSILGRRLSIANIACIRLLSLRDDAPILVERQLSGRHSWSGYFRTGSIA